MNIYDQFAKRVTAETTNAELAALAATVAKSANAQGILLVGDPLEYMTRKRNELIHELAPGGYLTSAQAARLVGWTPAHLRRLLESGQIAGRKAGRDWLILPEAISGVLPERKRSR